MKYLKNLTRIIAILCGFLVIIMPYLYIKTTKYASTEQAARDLYYWHTCSGDVILYNGGYRCDGYKPTIFLQLFIFVAVIAFIYTLVAFAIKILRKFNNHKLKNTI